MENLASLSDDTLFDNIDSLLGSQRELLARLLAYLGEVEARKLHLAAAYSSLHAFFTGRLRLSEDEACRRTGETYGPCRARGAEHARCSAVVRAAAATRLGPRLALLRSRLTDAHEPAPKRLE